MNGVLADLKRAEYTISGAKSQFCMSGIRVVGFICDSLGRHPDTSKVIKIVEWAPPNDVTEARAFIGVVVYYRVFVKNFSLIAAPIYSLMKKGAEFIWGTEQQLAMDALKVALTTAPALVTLDYSSGAEEIILAVDSSLKGWGAVLSQMIEK